jgi:hypothetical protein
MKKLLVLVACATLFGAGACSHAPDRPKMSMPSLPAPAPAPAAEAVVAVEPTARERVGRAIELLGAGRAEEAKVQLQAALAMSPKDVTALRLLEQIEKDPVVLLGANSEPYVIALGDTMSVLAERHLGDPLMFYALSRYNNLAAPNALSVGKTLRMPVRPGQTLQAAPAPAPVTPVRAVDAEKANATRLLALESLNNGDVSRAVILLKEAQSLNADDAAIGRDLDRALRIQSALTNG